MQAAHHRPSTSDTGLDSALHRCSTAASLPYRGARSLWLCMNLFRVKFHFPRRLCSLLFPRVERMLYRQTKFSTHGGRPFTAPTPECDQQAVIALVLIAEMRLRVGLRCRSICRLADYPAKKSLGPQVGYKSDPLPVETALHPS